MLQNRELQPETSEQMTEPSLNPTATAADAAHGEEVNPERTNGTPTKRKKSKKSVSTQTLLSTVDKDLLGLPLEERWVAIDEIDIPEEQIRRVKRDPKRFKDLEASIAKCGVLQPPVLSKKADGRYLAVIGFGRIEAAKNGGHTTIPARVASGEFDATQKLLLQLEENTKREDLNAMDRAEACIRYAELKGLTRQADIAEALGVAQSTVSVCFSLVKETTDEQKDKLRQGQLTQEMVLASLKRRRAKKLKKQQPEDHQAEQPETEEKPVVEFAHETWPYKDITLVARSKTSKHPSLDKIIEAVTNWLHSLHEQQKKAMQQS